MNVNTTHVHAHTPHPGWYVGSLTSVPNKVEQIKKLAYPFLWNSKPETLKRESLLNTFADGSVNIVYIRTKI